MSSHTEAKEMQNVLGIISKTNKFLLTTELSTFDLIVINKNS